MARPRKEHEVEPGVETDETPTAPKVIWRGQREWRHDLYKLKLSLFKKNESYRKYEPQLRDVEHVHFYHSTDRTGRPLETSGAVGGHFHKVTVKTLPDGTMTAECGPPIRWVERRQRNGKMVRELAAVKFNDGDDGRWITDDHTHEVEYLGSEMVSEAGFAKQASEDKAKLANLEQGRKAQAALS